MKLRRVHSWYQRLHHLRSKKIYYVSDGAGWSFDWDAHYLTTGLKQLGLAARITKNPWKLHNRIVHFGDRYTYFDRPHDRIHHSNHVFLTWFHGDPTDPNPDVQRLLAALPAAATHIEKTVVSCEISRTVLLKLGIPKEQIVLIPLGVDLAHFTSPTLEARQAVRISLGIPPDAICIGSFQKDGVGWEDGTSPKLVKGPDVFLEVIRRLASEHNNLIVLLTGPARGFIKRGLERMDVPYVHRFLSDYPEIVHFYHALDLYIISARSEGGPKALLECWATGVPVVSTQVGMAADLIRSGENGLLAAIEDTSMITEQVNALIADRELRACLQAQALQDVRRYDWLAMAEQYHYQLYQPFLS